VSLSLRLQRSSSVCERVKEREESCVCVCVCICERVFVWACVTMSLRLQCSGTPPLRVCMRMNKRER